MPKVFFLSPSPRGTPTSAADAEPAGARPGVRPPEGGALRGGEAGAVLAAAPDAGAVDKP